MTDAHRARLDQLRHALAIGAIDQDTFNAAAAAFSAQLSGPGAIAQGTDAVAVGAGGAFVGRDNSGVINLGVLIQQAARPGASASDLRRAYLARIFIQADRLTQLAGDTGSSQVRLSSVYTALLTQRAGKAKDNTSPLRGGLGSNESTRLSALDVLNVEDRLVLLGGPGSGKSTFVNYVALSMAGELLGLPEPNLATLVAPLPKIEDDDKDPQPQHWDHGARLPVQIVLRDLASQLPAKGAAVNAETVWRFIRANLKQAALEDFAPVLKKELLEHGGLVLLDGLDEVPDAQERREHIKKAVQDFAATFSRCRFLVTSRTYAYQRQDWKLKGFAEVQLQPFDRAQIHGYVDAWYAHMVGLSRLSENDAKGRAELLKRSIERNERLAELAARPLLLSLIARLQTEGGGALPEKREELYARAVELLLNQWESQKIRRNPDGSIKEVEPSLAEWLDTGQDAIRRELDKLAFEAHRDQADLVGTADIRQERLWSALNAAAPNKLDLQPKLLEAYLRDRAGLLAEHGAGLYQFPHRSFQEYLAACHLTVHDFPDALNALLRGDPNRWREVVLLAAAKAARGAPKSVWDLADALCPADDPPARGKPAPADLWGALLAGQALWETDLAPPNPNTAERNERKRTRVQRWMRAIVERGWLPPADRALAGRALSLLGDERDFDQLIAIAAGEFWMGSDDVDDEKPRHRVKLPGFSIARYPVTNAQYRQFVQATGHAWPSTEGERMDKRNHPAVDVRWHDALAYCKWLTAEWRQAGKIAATQSFMLPSEAEWERAARGTEGREFPWGDKWRDDCANTDEAGIGDTSAVGCFAAGASEAGCEDMAGNVWEWTRSLWGKDLMKSAFGYPYDPNDCQRENLEAGAKVRRMRRGGSWSSTRDLARAAFRLRNRPENRGTSIGFRVVLCSSYVS